MPPTVGSHMGRTWNNAPSSQLHGGYVNVNSAAKERTPNLVFTNTSLCTCSLRTDLWNLPVFSSFHSKIHDPGPLSKGLTDVLRMAQTEIKMLAKASSFDGWHLSHGTGQQVWQAGPSPWPQTVAREGKFFFSLKAEKHRNLHFHSDFTYSGWTFT